MYKASFRREGSIRVLLWNAPHRFREYAVQFAVEFRRAYERSSSVDVLPCFFERFLDVILRRPMWFCPPASLGSVLSCGCTILDNVSDIAEEISRHETV